MAMIQTGIELQDRFSNVILDFANAITYATDVAGGFQDVVSQDVDTSSFAQARDEIQSLMDNINGQTSPVITPEIDVPDDLNIPVTATVTEQPEIDVPESLEVPVTPVVTEQPNIEIPDMDVQGVQQFNSQIEQTQNHLQRVQGIQQIINSESQNVGVLPDDLQTKIDGVNNRLLQMQEAMNQISQNPFDLPTEAVEAELASLQSRIRETLQEQLELNETLSNMDIEIEQPPPVEIPVIWQTEPLDVFTSSGVERFQQEVQSANSMLEQLSDTQNEIARQAFNTNVLPPSAFQDMNRLAVRIDNVRERIQQIENNPLNIGTDRANEELERLRSQLSQAVQQQNDLNSAIDRMDVSGANAAYLQLSQTIGNTESYIRDNVNAQGAFNEEINEGTENANRLNNTLGDGVGKAQNFVRALMGLQIVQGLISMVSNQLDSAISRMDTMTNFSRTMTAITGSADLADASLQALKETTKGTAYGLDVAAAAVQNFATRGMDIGAATSEVGKWADAVAFYGDGTNETLTTVTDAIGKMMTKGTVEMDQLNRLTDAGINAVGIYAQATGQATADVQDNLSEGVISASEFITTVSTAFEEGTNGVLNIAGAAKEAGGTWATSIANAKAAVTRGIISMIDNINNALTNAGFGTILDGIKEFGVQAENVLSKVGVSVGTVIATIAPVADTIVGIFSYITDNAGITLDSILNGIVNFVNLAMIPLGGILSIVSTISTFIIDNWGMIAPIIGGIVTAIAAYNAALLVYNTIQAVSNGIKAIAAFMESVHSAAIAMSTGAKFAEAAATTTATGAQVGFNAALLACPLTWIILAIIVLIAVVIAVANHIANMGGTATTAFGVITGGINVVIQFFKNLAIDVANIALGIGNAIAALGSNIVAAFHNAITNVQTFFYNLLSTALSVISQIAAALSKLPFVEFDASGIASAADDYAAKAAAAQNSKMEYQSISDAYQSGASTFDRGSYSQAYKDGAAWGDGVSNKVSNAVKDFKDNFSTKVPQASDYANAIASSNNGAADLANAKNGAATAKNTGDTAKAAQKAAQSLDVTGENLKYIKDLAERDTINRFTTARINVKQTNHNTVNSNMDLDGINEYLRSDLEQRMAATAEGVH